MINYHYFRKELMKHLTVWHLTIIFFTAYISYYLLRVVKKPELVCSPCKFRDFLESNLPIVKQKFWPTIWCYESRAQTIMASVVRRTVLPKIKYRREILTLSDGGEVALDWREENVTPSSPIVLLLPGLTGCSQTDYAKSLALSASKIRVRFVVFNNRGLGGIQLKTGRSYCASNVEDISEVVRHVKDHHPNVPLGVVGVSLGGLIVGNYISKRPDESRSMLAAAMLISVPWNVFLGTKSLEKPVCNYLINRHLVSGLKNNLRERRHIFTHVTNFEKIFKSRTIREFDAHFTAKQFGYRDVEDYYSHATIHNKVPLMKIPTFCLSAADDPMQPLKGIPVETASHSKYIAILIPSRGGHIGFMEGFLPFYRNQFMVRCFTQYFTAMFKNDNYKQFF